MGFTWPWALAFLPVVPLAARWWGRRRRAALRYSDLRVISGLPLGSARRWERLGLILRASILALLILALAGPQIPDRTTRIPTEGIAIGFVCDVSGSMGERDFHWVAGEDPLSRFEVARRAFQLFVQGGTSPDGLEFPGRANDQVSLVTFAAWPSTECPLTLNHTVLLGILAQLEPKGAGLDAGTNIGDAIAEGLIRLKSSSDRRRVLVLLSDGEHNATGDGPDAPLTPRQAAQLAANLHIPIYTIDCGGADPQNASDDAVQQRQAGRATLKNVAEMTGGRYFSANNGPELREAYRAIDQLEREPILSYQYRRYFRYGPECTFLAAGAFLVLIAVEWLIRRPLP